jgi:hypothetical protein
MDRSQGHGQGEEDVTVTSLYRTVLRIARLIIQYYGIHFTVFTVHDVGKV